MDKVGQEGRLAETAALDQPEVHTDQMHLPTLAPTKPGNRVEQATLFQYMIRNVVVGVGHNPVAREDRVAVMPVGIGSVHAIGAVLIGACGKKV